MMKREGRGHRGKRERRAIVVRERGGSKGRKEHKGKREGTDFNGKREGPKMKRDPKEEKRGILWGGIFCLYSCIIDLSLIIATI